MKDRYRASGRRFQYEGTLKNILQIFQEQGVPFYQITSLRRLAPPAIASIAESLFTTCTNYEGAEAYQLDGEITIEQILTGQVLPVAPFNPDREWDLQQLQSHWNNRT